MVNSKILEKINRGQGSVGQLSTTHPSQECQAQLAKLGQSDRGFGGPGALSVLELL